MKKNEADQIVVYQPDETMRLDVRLDGETVWLNQQQMAVLFGRERSVVAKHIRNAFKEGELDPTAVCAKIAQTASDGKVYQVDFYNLDVIISVGYRVKSVRGNKVADSEVAKFNAQYGGHSVKTSAAFHDRFLVLDDRELYLIGASLKDLGKKCFAFTKLDAGEIAGLKARIRRVEDR